VTSERRTLPSGCQSRSRIPWISRSAVPAGERSAPPEKPPYHAASISDPEVAVLIAVTRDLIGDRIRITTVRQAVVDRDQRGAAGRVATGIRHRQSYCIHADVFASEDRLVDLQRNRTAGVATPAIDVSSGNAGFGRHFIQRHADIAAQRRRRRRVANNDVKRAA